MHFFEDYNNCFSRSNDKYVFSKTMSRSSLKKTIRKYIALELDSLTQEYNYLSPNYYFIIGSCFPCNNMLLKHIPENKMPKKLSVLIKNYPNIKYFLKEKDIHIDNELFNGIFEEIFNNYYIKPKEIIKDLGKNKTNVKFVKYRIFDCYSIYRMIKDMFGRINIINMHKVYGDKMKDVLRSVNEIIGSQVLKKKEICRDKMFDNIKEEIKSYMIQCMT